MESKNWENHIFCLDDLEHHGQKGKLSLTDIYRAKFEGKNAIDDLSFPF